MQYFIKLTRVDNGAIGDETLWTYEDLDAARDMSGMVWRSYNIVSEAMLEEYAENADGYLYEDNLDEVD